MEYVHMHFKCFYPWGKSTIHLYSITYIYMDSQPSYGKKQVHMLVVKSIFPVPHIYIFTSAFIPVVDPEVKYILKFNTSIF